MSRSASPGLSRTVGSFEIAVSAVLIIPLFVNSAVTVAQGARKVNRASSNLRPRAFAKLLQLLERLLEFVAIDALAQAFQEIRPACASSVLRNFVQILKGRKVIRSQQLLQPVQ